MLSKIIPAALLASTAFAAPAPYDKRQTAAMPFKFPLSNGFPNISIPSPALLAIEKAAHGTLPNTPLAKSLSATSVTDLQVIATNEMFEVAYFTSLIANITNGVSGYEVAGREKTIILEALTAIVNQEQLHALGANAILAAAGQPMVAPCEYVFGVDNLSDAINIARTFTDLVVSTLQSVQADFAADGDAEYIPLIGSIIGQESEQIGGFRLYLDLIPSALPFLTASTGQFAYSALNQLFLVPGSCPSAPMIKVPVFAPLTVTTMPIEPKTQTLSFSMEGMNSTDFSLVYINQQNLPIVEKPSNVQMSGSMVTFDAEFPYDMYLMNGLTIAAVTPTAGPFANAVAVSEVALAGPGLIEIM